MRPARIPIVVVAAAIASGTSAQAAERDGVTMPDRIEVAGRTLKLNGLGTREVTIFGIDAYVVGLYVPTPSDDPHLLIFADVPKRLVLQFVREVDADDLTETFQDAFEDNDFGPSALAKLARLNGWMSSMKPQERLAFTYLPGRGLVIEVNGVNRGTIEGRAFHSAFFAIWLGKHPPNDGLKRGLLGR